MHIRDLPMNDLWLGSADSIKSKDRHEIEAFIAQCFKREYDAVIQDYAEQLIGLRNSKGEIRIAAGYNIASQKELFLEQYLALPIDVILKVKTGKQVDRRKIIEVGNLASITNGGARIMIQVLSEQFKAVNPEFICMTANIKIRNTLQQMHLTYIELGKAEFSQLKKPGNWGSYYTQGNPIVIAIPYQPIV